MGKQTYCGLCPITVNRSGSITSAAACSLAPSCNVWRMKAASSAQEQAMLSSMMGKTAIANAKQTCQKYLRFLSGPRSEALPARGAKTQRVLWASTGTKNSAYGDAVYVKS